MHLIRHLNLQLLPFLLCFIDVSWSWSKTSSLRQSSDLEDHVNGFESFDYYQYQKPTSKMHIIRTRSKINSPSVRPGDQANPSPSKYMYLGSPVWVISADSKLTCAQSCAAQTGCTASMYIHSANMCNMYAEYHCNSYNVSCILQL